MRKKKISNIKGNDNVRYNILSIKKLNRKGIKRVILSDAVRTEGTISSHRIPFTPTTGKGRN